MEKAKETREIQFVQIAKCLVSVAFDANTRGQHNLGKVAEIRAERLDYLMCPPPSSPWSMY